MPISPFRNIILPALLVSSTTFAALTLPVASTQTHRVMEQWPTPTQAGSYLSSTHQQRGLSIRYIGFAMLCSTALGIGTAEVLRSRQTHDRRQRVLLKQALRVHPNDPPATTQGPQDGNSADASPALLPGANSVSEMNGPAQPPAGKTEPSAAIPAIDWDTLQSNTRPVAAAEIPSPGAAVDLLPEGNYPTWQIRTPDHQRLTAICIDGEFFSFYRLIKDLRQAHLLLETLAQTGQKLIVTSVQNDFVLWSYQPEAELATNAKPSIEPQADRILAQTSSPGPS